jgi:transcription elongation factor Elf1
MEQHDERTLYCPVCGTKNKADHTEQEERAKGFTDTRAYNIFNCKGCGRESQIYIDKADDDKALKTDAVLSAKSGE